MTEVRVLGPVEVWAGGRSIDLGAAKRRIVLAALAVNLGSPVSAETIIDRVWDGDAPAEARNVVYAHVSRIRRILADAAGSEKGPVVLERRSGGYAIRADPDRVDMHRFQRLVDRARAPQVADDERARLLREAMLLWRGDPLTGLAGEWVGRLRESLRRQHVDAAVAWSRVELRLGRHEVVIGALRPLVAEHATVEPLSGALMRALHLAGRSVEALDCYTALRERLVGELGVEPGPRTQALHQTILRGDLPDSLQGVPALEDSADLRATLELLAGQVTRAIEMLDHRVN
jgi:DNA-binding SARP family transcriptional activator